MLVLIRTIFVASVFSVTNAANGQLRKLQTNHLHQQLSNAEIQYLAGLADTRYTDEVLDNILIPRVVGTANHEKVFNYIKTELEKLDWAVEVDEFRTDTPIFGALTFKNIVASINPNADRYLVLACHYDSKYFANDIFVGAIDSAVPCAMMLNLAKVLNDEFRKHRDNIDLSLKLIFLDGEEAFKNWSPKDSIYGARHLAAKYHENRRLTRSTAESVTDLQRIDLFVLLDLIGHRDTTFYSYFPDTSKWYLRMAEAEDRLSSLGLSKPQRYRHFVKQLQQSYIEDDHIPFLRRNVPVVHLIATPFPPEWHTPRDDRDLIDLDTVENINKVLRIFVVEYLHIYLSDTSEENIPDKEL
ncbi:glutaminyl-peptide cyclotransferase [Cylas formicarius]|uniref:glutaminyl-peptide cyclotransferase n=1 Tax=Cylas formicarius TaxID=197179 RepID=UPI00295870F6|nr:glutaminyl-peptide cyclotransferase [Cylas formicarius]